MMRPLVALLSLACLATVSAAKDTGAFQIDSDTSPEGRPVVCREEAGGFVTIWIGWEDPTDIQPFAYALYGQRYSSAGAPKSDVFRIDQAETPHFTPALACTAD